jgi:hypothetical protein
LPSGHTAADQADIDRLNGWMAANHAAADLVHNHCPYQDRGYTAEAVRLPVGYLFAPGQTLDHSQLRRAECEQARAGDRFTLSD